MSYTPIISKILLSFLLTSTVLYRYGNWFRHHIIVTLTVLIAWYFSFLIVFALPLDVISVSIDRLNYEYFYKATHFIDCFPTMPGAKYKNSLQCKFYNRQ